MPKLSLIYYFIYGCALLKIFIPSESVKLNISQIVLINRTATNTVEFNADVNIFTDILWISDYVCKNHVIKNEGIQSYEETMVRCMALFTQTLRAYRVIAMKQIVIAFIRNNISLLEDGDLFAQSYVFEDNRERTICLFGEFEAFSLVPLIVARGIRNIFVFTRDHDVELYRSMSVYSRENFGTNIHILQSDNIIEAVHGLHKQGVNRFCDALYLKQFSDEDAHNLLEVFSDYYKQRLNLQHDQQQQQQQQQQQEPPIDVVWVRRYLTAPNASSSSSLLLSEYYAGSQNVQWSHSLLQWYLHSVWVKHSRLDIALDHNGFGNKAYGSDYDTCNLLSEVRLGAIGLTNPEKPASVTGQPDPVMIIVITYATRVFPDNAFAMKDALERLGFSMVYVLGDLSIAEYAKLRSLADIHQAFLLQIVMGADNLSMLMDNYILYHMEQGWSDVLHGTWVHRYSVLVRRAMSVWTFSSSLTEYFREMNYSSFTVPIYSGAAKNASFLQLTSLESSSRDIETSDMLFFGSCSPRRVSIIDYLVNIFRTKKLFKFHYACGSWSQAVFDVERDILVLRSKVVYNIHTEDDSVLEVHRVNYLLSLGKCVISERGLNDVDLDMEYADTVIFVDSIDEMYGISEYLLLHPAELAECEERSVRKYQQISANLTPLRDAMDYITRNIFLQSTL